MFSGLIVMLKQLTLFKCCSDNEISLIVDFQSLSLAKQFCALESTRFNLRACIFKKFSGGMPPDPLGGSRFAFWSVLHILSAGEPTYTYKPRLHFDPLYKSLDPPLPQSQVPWLAQTCRYATGPIVSKR